MNSKVRPPSRFVAWLALSAVLAFVASTLEQSIWQNGLIVLALLPAVAVALRAIQQLRPSIGQTLLVGVGLLLLSGLSRQAALVLAGGELLVVGLDLWLRSYTRLIHGAALGPVALVRIERLNCEELEPYANVKVHDRVVVAPGERVPVDGRLVSHTGRLRLQFWPRQTQTVASGELVVAGSHAASRLVLEALNVGSDTTTAQLNAHAKRVTAQLPPLLQRLERLLALIQLVWSGGAILVWFMADDRVLFSWVALAGVWWLGTLLGRVMWLRLVSKAARAGYFVTSWEAVPRSRHLQTAVFGKTGILTVGEPHLLEVIAAPGARREDILRVAAALELESDHPIARTIKRSALVDQLAVPAPTQVEVRASLGQVGTIEGDSFAVGSSGLMRQLEVPILAELQRQAKLREAQGATTIYVASAERVLGLLVLKDVVRPSATGLIKALGERGITQVQLVSGDAALVTRAVAATLGIPAQNVSARMTAQHKERHVKQLQRSATMVVADPVSDSAMLAPAGLGVAFMGWGTALKQVAAQVLVQAPTLEHLAQLLGALRGTASLWWLAPVISAGISLAAVATLLTWRAF
ncbi:MAG: HAD-IC family P-type ATPase [Parcubacteria group bacterium]